MNHCQNHGICQNHGLSRLRDYTDEIQHSKINEINKSVLIGDSDKLKTIFEKLGI